MSGPMPVAEFMHWCMADPQHGYYAKQKAIGAKGDFITAPEISQMFGELIGVWTIATWQELGAPTKFNLVELGPGKGTLMKDLLRAARSCPEFLAGANVQMIETSDALAAAQRELLAQHSNINWHQSIKDIPAIPTILIGNEFLDVLPIRQYVKVNKEWRERAVGLDESGNLTWTIGNATLETTSLPENAQSEPDGALFEISTIRESFIINTAEVLKESTGAALFIDYGHKSTGFGDTLQAMRNHEYAEILGEPGMADLTAHVDFGALLEVAKASEVQCQPIATQGEFLLSLGLLERAGTLGAGQSVEVQNRLKGEAERLALPHEMGNLFKVFGFSNPKIDMPGFRTDNRQA